MRSRILGHIGTDIVNTQNGSRMNGAGCDVAHLMARAAVDAAVASCQSIALLFVDVATAFATRCLALALPDPETLYELAWNLSTLGYTRDEVCKIIHVA